MGFIIGALMACMLIWIISTRRRLYVLEENIDTAMNQIGVQLSSRFDALLVLLDSIKDYRDNDVSAVMETVKARRNVITAKSMPEEVQEQEKVVSEALWRVLELAEQYPELKEDANYLKRMNAVESYENMLRVSRLIYNDSVTRLNRELQTFPTSWLAGVSGMHKRNYLENTVGSSENI